MDCRLGTCLCLLHGALLTGSLRVQTSPEFPLRLAPRQPRANGLTAADDLTDL